MLIRLVTLDAIAAGDVDTQFRRQKRPTVKPGGTLKTKVGVLEILEVTAIGLDDVTDEDARRSGAVNRHEVIAELQQKPEGEFLRVRLRYAGADPRIALRSDATLTDTQVAELLSRLDRLDRASSWGAWTRPTLRLIAAHQGVRAPDLAASVGRETQPFKTDVRKLKALGLTISLPVGYEISARADKP